MSKLTMIIWNEFIAQTANGKMNFSYAMLEKRINEVLNEEALAQIQPTVIVGSLCTCTQFRETPEINGRHICSFCNNPILPINS
jgi:hypothetical protein